MSGPGFISAELPQQCDACGQVDELRPYGPGGKKICHPCLEAHPEWEQEAKARYFHLVHGEPLPKEYQ